jgi:CubicO group peptidase (beta-lactamase class C family)/lysophospholipase L1-like esterase
MDGARLAELWSTLQKQNTKAFLVIRNDKIVYEKYSSLTRDTRHYTASMAKALVGGVSLMVAMNDGLISPEDAAARYIPQWAGIPGKSGITIRELATHTSGIEDSEEGELPHSELTGWKKAFWDRLPVPNDPFTIARDNAPLVSPPGTALTYSNPGYAVLSQALTEAISATETTDLRSLISARILKPIGVSSTQWDCGYNQTFYVDGLPLVATWGGANFSPNASARVARLLLKKGNWGGSRLIRSDIVEAATTHPVPGLPGDSLFGWWGNRDGNGARMYPSLPADAFYASGAGHQVILIVPSLDLIVVRNGEEIVSALGHGEALENHLFAPLMASFLTPMAETDAAGSQGFDGAILNGTVNPNGSETTAWFEWGTDPSLSTFLSTTSQSLGQGRAVVAVSQSVTGLLPEATYYFRIAASGSAGTMKGTILSLKTSAQPLPPAAATGEASSLVVDGAVLNGSVNPNGQATAAWFEWGTDPSLGAFSTTQSQAIEPGTTVVAISAVLQGLNPATKYFFRAAGANPSGTTKGSIRSVTTPAVPVPPTVTTGVASSVTAEGALLSGNVNPNGLETISWFEWGTVPGPSMFSLSPLVPMGSGVEMLTNSVALLGLTPGTTYHFRAAASSSAGTSRGAVLSFVAADGGGGAWQGLQEGNLVAVGDGMTKGDRDDIPGDGTGFEPILGLLLSESTGRPVEVFNEGASGATSADGAASIAAVLAKYPSARYYLIMYGSGDAIKPAVPSGRGLLPGDAGYAGSYKENIQRLITAVLAAGKVPCLAEVPYTTDPARDSAMIFEYNAALDELYLTNDLKVEPPPMFQHFQSHPEELSDGVHPNGTGYRSMGNLWFEALF